MTDFLEPMRRELKRLNDRIDGLSTFQWALVSSISPLRVHFAGDDDPVSVPPDTIAANLVVGDMVRVERKGAHMTIHGVGKGADNPRHFSSKAALDLWMPVDGTHAWVGSEKKQYIRANGTWTVNFYDTGWLNLGLAPGIIPVDGHFPQLRVEGSRVQFRGRIDATGVPNSTVFIANVSAQFRPDRAVVRPLASDSAPHRDIWGGMTTGGDLLYALYEANSSYISLDNMGYLLG